MIFQREAFSDAYRDSVALMHMHYEEIAWRQDKITLLPDLEMYFVLEQTGRLVCFTAREDGILWGYAVFVIQQHLHYKKTRWAANDIIFIHPSKRQATLGSRFVSYAEEQLKILGAEVITYHVKHILNWGALLERKGYESNETNWNKWVGD